MWKGHVRRLTLTVRQGNLAAIAVYSKLSFTYSRTITAAGRDEDDMNKVIYVLEGEALEVLRVRGASEKLPRRMEYAIMHDAQQSLLDALNGASTMSRDVARLRQISMLCASNLHESHDPAIADEQRDGVACKLLTPSEGRGLRGHTDYCVAMLPYLDLVRESRRGDVIAVARCEGDGLGAAFHRENGGGSLEDAMAAYDEAFVAAEQQAMSIAERNADALWQRVKPANLYLGRFVGGGEGRGYVGSTANSIVRTSHHDRKKGARWTATSDGYPQWTHEPVQRLPMAAHLAAEIREVIKRRGSEPARKWRGGPFLQVSEQHWDSELRLLWDALIGALHALPVQ